MRVEVRINHAARRRSRLGAIAFAASILGAVPIVFLALAILRLALGRQVATDWGSALFALPMAMAGAAWFYGTSASFHYRCPQCRGRTRGVEPVGEARPNIAHHCPRCGVIWDLGWGWGEAA